MKHLIKYKLDGKSKQKLIEAKDIYEAERRIRKINNVFEDSERLYIKTIKVGRTEYQINGTTLGN